MPISKQDREIYEYALRHLRAEREALEEKILNVERQLGPALRTTATPMEPQPVKTARKKRVMSAEGKARIAEAQRKRWAKAAKANKEG